MISNNKKKNYSFDFVEIINNQYPENDVHNLCHYISNRHSNQTAQTIFFDPKVFSLISEPIGDEDILRKRIAALLIKEAIKPQAKQVIKLPCYVGRVFHCKDGSYAVQVNFFDIENINRDIFINLKDSTNVMFKEDKQEKAINQANANNISLEKDPLYFIENNATPERLKSHNLELPKIVAVQIEKFEKKYKRDEIIVLPTASTPNQISTRNTHIENRNLVQHLNETYQKGLDFITKVENTKKTLLTNINSTHPLYEQYLKSVNEFSQVEYSKLTSDGVYLSLEDKNKYIKKLITTYLINQENLNLIKRYIAHIFYDALAKYLNSKNATRQEINTYFSRCFMKDPVDEFTNLDEYRQIIIRDFISHELANLGAYVKRINWFRLKFDVTKVDDTLKKYFSTPSSNTSLEDKNSNTNKLRSSLKKVNETFKKYLPEEKILDKDDLAVNSTLLNQLNSQIITYTDEINKSTDQTYLNTIANAQEKFIDFNNKIEHFKQVEVLAMSMNLIAQLEQFSISEDHILTQESNLQDLNRVANQAIRNLQLQRTIQTAYANVNTARENILKWFRFIELKQNIDNTQDTEKALHFMIENFEDIQKNYDEYQTAAKMISDLLILLKQRRLKEHYDYFVLTYNDTNNRYNLSNAQLNFIAEHNQLDEQYQDYLSFKGSIQAEYLNQRSIDLNTPLFFNAIENENNSFNTKIDTLKKKFSNLDAKIKNLQIQERIAREQQIKEQQTKEQQASIIKNAMLSASANNNADRNQVADQVAEEPIAHQINIANQANNNLQAASQASSSPQVNQPTENIIELVDPHANLKRWLISIGIGLLIGGAIVGGLFSFGAIPALAAGLASVAGGMISTGLASAIVASAIGAVSAACSTVVSYFTLKSCLDCFKPKLISFDSSLHIPTVTIEPSILSTTGSTDSVVQAALAHHNTNMASQQIMNSVISNLNQNNSNSAVGSAVNAFANLSPSTSPAYFDQSRYQNNCKRDAALSNSLLDDLNRRLATNSH